MVLQTLGNPCFKNKIHLSAGGTQYITGLWLFLSKIPLHICVYSEKPCWETAWLWLSVSKIPFTYVYTVKPVSRPPFLTDHTFLAQGSTFQYNWTCHRRPPVLTDHIRMANGVVFQDWFYCTDDLKIIPTAKNPFKHEASKIKLQREILQIILWLKHLLGTVSCE